MSDQAVNEAQMFETESVWKIIWKLTPPVMLSSLVYALYNLVDSYFIGKYSTDGLTALSVIFPLQLLLWGLGTGIGTGVNTQMSKLYAQKRTTTANYTGGAGQILAFFAWLLLAIFSIFFMKLYVTTTASSEKAIEYAIVYGNIAMIGSLPISLVFIWEKIHQSHGNMKLPMIGMVCGAITNTILDPIFIFGLGPIPSMGVAGAAYATIIGQTVNAIIIFRGGWRPLPKLSALNKYSFHIFKLGFPALLMQCLFTFYIYLLNVILAGFCDESVTVLGLYYKLQTFFFIPLFSLQIIIVPVLSYNYERKLFQRCHKVLIDSILFSAITMIVGVISFEIYPVELISLFSTEPKVIEIGITAFRGIGASFIPACASLTFPIYFQAIGMGKESSLLTILRQIFCLVPIFWLLSKIGLDYAWWSFPISEIITTALGVYLYRKQRKLEARSQKLEARSQKLEAGSISSV